MIRGALVSLFLVAAVARAGEEDLKPELRIQRRFVEKKGRLAAYVGFAYLGRSDFYRSPGVEVAASYYWRESLAVDLRAAWLFSFPTDELRDLTRRTGFVPDSHPSVASILIGARYSVGYAKLRIANLLVLHFEPQVFLYAGVHITSGYFSQTAAGPLGEIGIGFLIHATPHLQARIDAGITVGGEQRSSYVAVVGGYPVASVGVMF